ncbi:MAG TPA: hypothetical protein PKY81_17060, partial [bacterium]|nr:hypothetical protein [bacterium]
DTIYAAKFIGDGSGLTGVGVSGGAGIDTVSADARYSKKSQAVFSDTVYITDTLTIGSTNFIVTKDGKVGIGLNNPSYNLDVKGIGRIQGSSWGTTGDTTIIFLGDQNHKIEAEYNGVFKIRSLDPISLGTPTTEYFRILSTNGNVGIGATAPSTKLHIAGGDLTIGNNDARSLIFDDISTAKWKLNPTGYKLSFSNDSGGWGERVVFTNTGNVGIGTISPQENLDIVTSANGAGIKIGKANIAGYSALRLIGADDSSKYAYIQAGSSNLDDTAKLRVSRYGSATDTLALFEIYSSTAYFSGNVGIDTIQPTHKLSVNGDINITGTYRVNGTPLSSGIGGGGTANYLSKFTAGSTLSNSVIYENTNNIGIGITTPLSLLHLYSNFPSIIVQEANVNETSALIFKASTGATVGGIISNAATGEIRIGAINTAGAYFPTFYSNNSEIMRISTTGNVGIGTTTPMDKLHINDSSAINGWRARAVFSGLNKSAVIGVYNDSVIVGAHSANLGSWENIFINTGGDFTPTGNVYLPAAVGIATQSVPYALNFGTNKGILLNALTYGFAVEAITADTDYLKIKSVNAGTNTTYFDNILSLTRDGKIGVGTNSPNQKLHIYSHNAASNGGILLANSSANDATRAVVSAIQSNEIRGLSDVDLDAGQLRLSAGGGTNSNNISYIDLYGFSTRDMRFGTAGTEKMRILENGNIGIGTTSPADKLHINGGLIVGNTANTNAGTIRWTGANFEGYTGVQWKALDAEPTGSAGGWTDDGSVVRLTTSSDNVGIGTATPNRKLSIENAGAGMMRLNNSTLTGAGSVWDLNIGNTNSLELGRSGINNDLVIDSGGGIALAAGALPANGAKLLVGNNYLTVGSTGFIGIGNAAPTHKLEVHGTQLIKPDALWSGGDSATLFLGDNNSYISNENGSSLNIGAFHGITINASTSNGSTDAHIFKVLKYGVEKFRIDNNGNVGIGNATPAYKLDVAGDINITGDFRVNGTTLAAGIGGSGTTNYIPKFSSGTTLTNSVLNESAGNIGIGLTPQYGKLEISAAAAAADIAGLYLRNGAADQSGNAISLTFATCLASSIGQAKISAIRAGVTGEGDLGFYTYNGAMNERLRITNTGNIGIGTANPAGTLDVRAANPEISINRSAATGYNHLKWGTAGTAFWSLQTQANQNDLQLYNYGTSSFILTMLASNGNVGVGTTNPASKLDVQGDIYASADNSVITALGDNMGIVKKAGTGPVIAAGSGDPLRLGHWNTATLRGNIASGSFTERMTIATNGNVGIGTASPAYQLEVKSSSPYISATATDGNGNAIIYADKGATGWGGYEMKVGGVEKFVMGIQPSATTLDWW